MDESIAYSGAICGWADNEDEDLFIYNNTFVSDTLGGIDGISYDEAAEPVSYRELYEMEGVPERFRSLRVSFRAEGLIIRELSVPYGGSVLPEEIPPVPEVSGYSGFWPETDLTDLTSSVTIDAVYLDRLTGLSAEYSREGTPLSVVIVEGLFEPESSVSVSDWSNNVVPAEHYKLCEALKVNITSRVADLESHSIHYLIPETSFFQGNPVLCVRGENGLEVREYKLDGSYLVFDSTGSEICFCVLVSEWNPTVLIIGAGAIVLLLAIIVLVLVRTHKKHRSATAANTPSGETEMDEKTENEAEPAEEPQGDPADNESEAPGKEDADQA